MSEPLIDEATFDELRAIETSAMGQLASIARDEAPIASHIPITIVPASISAGGFSVHAAIIGLGGGRADHVGFMPYATDVIDGDVLTVDSRIFTVCGAAPLDTCVGLALSEVRRG